MQRVDVSVLVVSGQRDELAEQVRSTSLRGRRLEGPDGFWLAIRGMHV